MFATLKGVVARRPGEVSVNTLPPPVLIESAVVDGVEQTNALGEQFPPDAGDAIRLVVAGAKQQVRIHSPG